MMHSSNGSSDRYSGLPMDYGMHHPHHPAAGPPQQHPHHPEHAHLAAHYALPPSHHPGGGPIPHHAGLKRSPESAGLEMMSQSGGASSDEEGSMHDVKPAMGERGAGGCGADSGVALNFTPQKASVFGGCVRDQ